MKNKESLWNCPLRGTSAAQQRIQLTLPQTRAVHFAFYKAGPRASGFGKMEIDKMLEIVFIKLTGTEWAASIVSPPREGQILRLLRRLQEGKLHYFMWVSPDTENC